MVEEVISVRSGCVRWVSEFGSGLSKKELLFAKKALGFWCEYLGGMQMRQVKPKHVAGGKAVLRARGLSGKTVNNYLVPISRVFRVGVEEWFVCRENPVRGVRREPVNRIPVTRFLSEEELARLLRCCRGSQNPDLYRIVVIALSTGMRKTEIKELEWKRVYLDEGWLYLNETKNGRPRRVILSGVSAGVLRGKLKESGRGRYVFPSLEDKNRPYEFEKAWERARERAELKDFRFHDLRHTCASYLAMNGASTLQIAEVLGHRTLEMVQRYAHLTEGSVRGVVDKMANRYLHEHLI